MIFCLTEPLAAQLLRTRDSQRSKTYKAEMQWNVAKTKHQGEYLFHRMLQLKKVYSSVELLVNSSAVQKTT